MSYVLIIMATVYGGANVSQQEYTTKERCEAAMAIVKKYTVSAAFCVQK